MNSPSSHHEPSPGFRAQLKREISRAVRSDQLFGPPPAPARTRRVVMALGIAGGVALTLFTGMILGASASYASAAEPDAPRPTLAIRPISNALSAIGCGVTKTEPQTPKTARVTTPVQPSSAIAVTTDTAPPVARRGPDRAKIAALASQHQSNVVRGDTAAEYIVMVLDAADKYVWSTYGSGNLSIEVAGDRRTRAERLAYTREFAAEFGSPVAGKPSFADFVRNMPAGGGARGSGITWRVDSLNPGKRRVTLDSLRVIKHADIGQAKGFKRIGADSLGGYFRMRGDSTMLRDYVAGMVTQRGGGGGGGRGGGGGAARGGMDTDTATTYKAGWAGTRHGTLTNQALGLDVAGSGDGYSGITGLPSAWIALSETYFFEPGQLAPHDLKILVVRLTPGTVWTGR